jgi:two-component system LytT family sensor kinase
MATFRLLETAMLLIALLTSFHFYTKYRNGKKSSPAYPQGNLLSAHFLLNALDCLPRTIEQDGQKAHLYSKNLSIVLRQYIKYANQSSVSLQQELEMVGKYFSLLQEIHSKDIQLDINIPSSIAHQLTDYRITPMSIQLAVENAVKHNSPTKNNVLSINIIVSETGISVTNNRSHLQKIVLQPPSGIGLKYLRSKTLAIMQKPLVVEETKNIYSIHFPITKQTCPDEYSFDRRQQPIGKGTNRTSVAV